MKINQEDIAILGVPFDQNSSYRRGAALGPQRIRESLYCESSNLWTESLLDLGAETQWKLAGDIEFRDGHDAFMQIRHHLADLLEAGARVVSLGGDHSITYPILQAYAAQYAHINILHLDAHPDLYDELEGNRYSHACPFARIMEENLVARLVQVGIRTLTGHQDEQAKRFGVEIIPMKELERAASLKFDGPVYLSLDLDCLDPAFAPGVSHHEPGGMSTREVLAIIQGFQGRLAGADIVEYNPDRDINGSTGMVAAKMLKEIVSRMLGES